MSSEWFCSPEGESGEDGYKVWGERAEWYIGFHRSIFGQNSFAESEAIARMFLLKWKGTFQCVHMLFNI